MTIDSGRTADADGLSQAEPEVSALRASIPCADSLTKDEKSFLLYAESRCVDHGGLLTGVQMNADDHEAAKRFCDLGFMFFGRIPGALLKDGYASETHFAELTLAGWEMAWQLRRARSLRRGPYATSVFNHPITLKRLASAMSARSAETAGLSPQDASAVPQADAQPIDIPSDPQP